MDSGFVGSAALTQAWVERRTPHLHRVVNTHWHSDHVGGNALLQAHGAAIAASTVDAAAVARRDPGCCSAEYLDKPVPAYTIDESLQDGQTLPFGDGAWTVIDTPGHTQGHVALWCEDDGLLAVGDVLSTYDVGWVNLALDGPEATKTAFASLQRLANLSPRVLLPALGPIPEDAELALERALVLAQRLVDDHDGAVWYGARRCLPYALMIREGMPLAAVDDYLLSGSGWSTPPAPSDVRPPTLPTNSSAPCSGPTPSPSGTADWSPRHSTICRPWKADKALIPRIWA